MAESRAEQIWECKIGGIVGPLPRGADSPMRLAIAEAFRRITGVSPEFNFSGWSAELSPIERGIIEEDRAKREAGDV